MPKYEYRVIPAPDKGLKARGVKGTKERFANALQVIMNEQGQDGWQYLRTDTLPCDERQGLTRRNTVYQNMLVFSRELETAESDDAITRSQKAIERHSAPVAAEPTELWDEVETESDAESVSPSEEFSEVLEEGSDNQRLGGVTRDKTNGA